MEQVKKKRKAIPYKTKVLLQKEISSKCPFCKSDSTHLFEIHHIDANTENNNLDNLIMLCPTCHSKIEKGDILLGKVKEIKGELLKVENKLTFKEKIELEKHKAEMIRLRKEYLNSQQAKDDIFVEANKLFQIIQEKCGPNGFSKTNGFIQVAFSHVYIIVEFHPQFIEYQISCTFNESWVVERERGSKKSQFRIYRYNFDKNDSNTLGWNDGHRFYTSEDLAEFLLNELYEINKIYFDR